MTLAADTFTPNGLAARRRVAVLVDAAVAARWRAEAIAHLRAAADVRVLVAPCPRHPAAAPGPAARLVLRTAAALRPVPLPEIADAGPTAPGTAGEAVLDLRACAALPHDGASPHLALVPLTATPELPFLAEIAEGARAVEVELRGRSPDGRTVLVERGRYRVGHTYGKTTYASLLDAARWPARLVARPRDGGLLAAPAVLPAARAVGAADVLRVLPRLVRQFAGAAWEFLFLDAVWNVGIAAASPARMLAADASPVVRWYRERPSGFIADPHVVEVDGARQVLVEHVTAHGTPGRIAALPFDDLDAAPREVITRPGHLSYPSPFTWKGRTYLAIEGQSGGTIPIYRLEDGRWEPVDELRPADDLLDPTIFAHEGRWWLLGTRRGADSNAHLFAWYADAPLGPWRPHPRNPVKTDAAAARPAGPPFRLGEALLRPAQDSTISYGGGLTICRIERLTPEAFEETEVARLGPIAGSPYPDGIHTFTALPDRVVVDGKRLVFRPGKPLAALRERAARRAAARAGAPAPSPAA